MLFIWGRRNTTVRTGQAPELTCAHCGQQGTMYISIIARYAHLFWIPLFSLGKSAYSICTHCKQTLAERATPSQYRPAIAESKAAAKIPAWHFAGLLIVGGFIILSMVMAVLHKLS